MKTYKVIFTAFAVMVLGAFTIGCSSDNDNSSSKLKSINEKKIQSNPNFIELEKLVIGLLEKQNTNTVSKTTEQINLTPIINSTKNLLNDYGITEEDLINEFGGIDDRIGLTGIIIVSEYSSNSSIDMDKAIDCLVEALGLNVFDAIREVGQAGTKKALIKIVRGVASRFLGPIGLAITVAEWAWCYGR